MDFEKELNAAFKRSPAVFFQDRARDHRRLSHTEKINDDAKSSHGRELCRALGIDASEVDVIYDPRTVGSFAGCVIRMWANRPPYPEKTWSALFRVMLQIAHPDAVFGLFYDAVAKEMNVPALAVSKAEIIKHCAPAPPPVIHTEESGVVDLR